MLKKEVMSNSTEYNFGKLIGYSIDTNQVKCDKIKSEQEAKDIILKIIEVYGSKMLSSVKLINSRFTSYTYHYSDNLKDNINLLQYIK